MAEQKKKSSWLKYVLSFALLILLIVLTFVVIFQNNDMEQIWEAVVNCAHKEYLFIAFAVVIGYLLFYAVFTLIPLRARNHKASLGQGFIYACADFFYAAITPSAAGGEPMVIYTMTRDGVPLSHSSLTVVTQAMYNRGALLVYGVFAMIFAGGTVFAVSPLFNGLIALGLALNVAIVLFCFAAMKFPGFILKIGNAVLRFLNKIKIVKDLEKASSSFETQVKEYKVSSEFLHSHPVYGIKMFLACFAQRGCMFLAAYLVYASFGNVSLNFLQVMSVQAMVCIVVDNIPLPGAMGANEWATGAIYMTMYSSAAEATAAMLLHRAITFYYPLVISGIVSVVKYFTMVMKKKE